MDKIKKIVHMVNGEKMIIPQPTRYFTLGEKHHIIQAYFSSCISKNLLWKKYTGNPDHGRLLVWIRKLGYGDTFKQEKAKFAKKTPLAWTKKQ